MLVFKSMDIKLAAIAKKVSSTRFSSLESVARIRADKIFRLARANLISAFDKHPITKEIVAGPQAKNTSGTLAGYGNLFSFIGFNVGEKPTEKLRELLYEGTQISAARYKKSRWSFLIKTPSRKSIESVTRMNWSSESWALAVESHISGLGYYIRTNAAIFSRSKAGYQGQTQQNNSAFSPRAYLTELLSDFKMEVNTKSI